MDLEQFDMKIRSIQHILLRLTAICVALIIILLAIVINFALPNFIPLSVYPALFKLVIALAVITIIAFPALILTLIIKYNIFNNNKIVFYALKHKAVAVFVFYLFIIAVVYIDGYILPYANYERFRQGQRPIFMFTSSLLRYKDGGSQDYFGISYKILYYKQEAHDGIRTGPRLTYNFTLPFRDQTTKEEVFLRKFGR